MLIIPSRTPTTSNNYPTNSLRFIGNVKPITKSLLTTGPAFTISFWMKRGKLTAYQYLFAGADINNGTNGIILNSDQFQIIGYKGGATTQFYSTTMFRDTAAWYHIVLTSDSSGNAALYVNGVLNNSASAVFDGFTTAYGNATIGDGMGTGGLGYVGLLADFYFIDNQALTPSNFASTDSASGQWRPAPYMGTYGTNGFHLEFKDTSGNTSGSNAGIGKDTSGNGKYWNTTGFNTTSSSYLYDCLTDVPAPASATSANYCTLNPLDTINASKPINANLTTNAGGKYFGTHLIRNAKYYWELYNSSGASFTFGIMLANGQIVSGNFNAATLAATYVGIRVDATGTGVWDYTTDGSTWTNVSNVIGTGPMVPYIDTTTSGPTVYTNFGQQPWHWTPPSGYSALNTFNMPAPTIALPNKHFDVASYTGNGTSQTISSLAFQPDLIWIKNRGASTDHIAVDIVRGAAQVLYPDSNIAEASGSTAVSAFTSSGFTVGANNGSNQNATTFVGWSWKASNGTASNTNGSITSTVSVNATAGFSIVQYQGTGANATVGHGLGVTPKFIIIKNRSTGSTDWVVWHTEFAGSGPMYYCKLNATSGVISDATIWNNVAPGASVFNIGTNTFVNTSGSWYIAYCFTDIPGYSFHGYYQGNGVTDGPFVYTGFRPRFIIGKNAGGAADWWMFDTVRQTSKGNPINYVLYPDQAVGDQSVSPSIDIYSNGFKIRTSTNFGSSADANTNAAYYLVTAFAEAPFQYANAR